MKGDKCATYNCVNTCPKGRYCHTCRSRITRSRYPIRYTYSALRTNAKRRRIVFELSYEYFESWCLENKYMELKGNGAEDMTIDRDNPNLGYVEGNLKMITRLQNVAKQYTDKYKYLHNEDDKWVKYAEEIRKADVTQQVTDQPPF